MCAVNIDEGRCRDERAVEKGQIMADVAPRALLPQKSGSLQDYEQRLRIAESLIEALRAVGCPCALADDLDAHGQSHRDGAGALRLAKTDADGCLFELALPGASAGQRTGLG